VAPLQPPRSTPADVVQAAHEAVVSATIASLTASLSDLYRKDRVTAELAYGHVHSQIVWLRGVTYEHRDRLMGQLHAARRLAKRRGQIFDAVAWWEAHRP
jgi:hypothetical protein